MPRHLISDAHEWINEIPTVPVYYPAKPQPRERAWQNQRGKKTCRHRRKIFYKNFLFFLFIFLDTDPHLASVVCVPLSLFRFEIRVVCVWELVYVCACEHKFGVATNHGKF
jgi:hypothetical protein